MKTTDSPNFDKLTEAARLTMAASDCEYHGSLEEAQRLYEEALVIYEDLLGLQNPTTAKTINNVARICRALGKTAEASMLEDQAQSILERYSEGQVQPSERTLFGGSSGFWELLGHRSHSDGDGDAGSTTQLGSEA